MNYQVLKEDSNNALKQGNKLRRLVLSDICASIEAASIKQKTEPQLQMNLLMKF